MKKVYTISVALTKNWLRSKFGVFFSFLFPVVLLLMFMALFGEGGPVEDMEHAPIDHYLPGLIATFVMVNGVLGVTINITEYKRNGTLKRLIASPLRKRDWVLANVAQQTLLAVVMTVVMILIAIILFDAQVHNAFYSLGFIFVGAIAFCTVGMVLGGLLKDSEAASGVGNAIAFPMMFLSGAFVPFEMMPDYLQVVARFLPLYYFYTGLQEVMVLENPSGAVTGFLVIGIFAIFFLVLAVTTIKWKDM